MWLLRLDLWENMDPQCVHGNFWPSWMVCMCIFRCCFSVALCSQCGHGNFRPSWTSGLHALIWYVSKSVLLLLLWNHNLYMETFDLHDGLILCLCVFEGSLFELLCVHIEGMGTFDLHGLIFCVSSSVFSQLICVHIVSMETFDLDALILYVTEGVISVWI